MTNSTHSNDTRAVSELYGTVLLISISLITALLIIGLGGTVIGSIFSDTEDRITQDSMMEMDDRLTTISGSQTDASTSFTYPSFAGDELTTYPDRGSVEIEAEATVDEEYLLDADGTGNSTSFTLGTVEHVTHDGTTIAYQGGAVIQQQGTHSVLLSPPPIDFDGTQLSLGFTDISALDSLSGGEEIRATKSTERSEKINEQLLETVEPYSVIGSNGEVHGTAPVNVTMTIETEYVDAWKSHFTTELRTPIYEDGITVTDSSVTVKFTLGDEFGILRNDSFFEYDQPQTIYAGPSQFAQYHDEIEPVDGGPAFKKSEDEESPSSAIIVYHPDIETWVLFDGGDKWEGYGDTFDYSNQSHVDGLPLEEVEDEITRGITEDPDGDGYIYHFEDDALICLSNQNLNSEEQAQQCAENLTDDPEAILDSDTPFPVSELFPLSAELNVIEFSR